MKPEDIFGKVVAPSPLGKLIPANDTQSGEKAIGTLLGNFVQLIFVVGTVGFVFMILLSAIQMIFSGGDKEGLAKARGRLTWAIIGIVLLSLSFVIFRVLEGVTGFKFVF